MLQLKNGNYKSSALVLRNLHDLVSMMERWNERGTVLWYVLHVKSGL